MSTWLPKLLILLGILLLVWLGRACMMGYLPVEPEPAERPKPVQLHSGKSAYEVPKELPRPLMHLSQIDVKAVEIVVNADEAYRAILAEELGGFFKRLEILELKTTELAMDGKEIVVVLRAEFQQEGKVAKLPAIEAQSEGALEAATRIRDAMMMFRAGRVPKSMIEARITYHAKIVKPTAQLPRTTPEGTQVVQPRLAQ
jgi:hypothetical protein